VQYLPGKVMIEQYAYQLFALARAVHIAVIVCRHIQ
jgi:hypothetical protein